MSLIPNGKPKVKNSLAAMEDVAPALVLGFYLVQTRNVLEALIPRL